MALHMRWNGRELPLVTNPSFEELSIVERAVGCGWSALSEMEQGAGRVLITLRRTGIVLGWKDVVVLSPAELIFDAEPEPDPTPAADIPAAPAPAESTAEATTPLTPTTASRRAAATGSRTTGRRSKRSTTSTS